MPRQIGSLRAWVECAAMAPPWAFLRLLPLESAVRMGAAAGALVAKLDPVNRRIAMRNLQIAFPERDASEHRRILTAAYRNYGRMAAEWLHAFEFTRANIEQYVTYESPEYWKDAIRISGGRGILVLTGHFGNFELLSLAHSIYGNRIAIVQRPNRNPIIDAAVTARRTHFGNVSIPRKGAAREVLRLLKDNWMVTIPLDLDTRRGVFVKFFSKPAATNEALARIAMATGAPVLPAFMVRGGSTTRHRIKLLPVIELERRPDRRESVLINTQRFTDTIEEMIRLHPDHWNWIHRRWKTRPPGEDRFY
ncbi:MAG TPA: lysophospholipid acyltransferase family protein [Candidatus Binataceae bacterium]|nr:lysophospholipid acyltransferase family protein [Candidatus Binataceae bacterium]